MPRGDDLDALIAQAQDGDVHAFETLLATYIPQVRRFARAFARSDADADDLAQDAVIKVYRNLRLFRYQSAFSTWIFAVVRNSFLDAAKSRAGRERASEERFGPEHGATVSEAEGPDEQLVREQERARLWDALRQIPAEFRTAIVLFDIEGASYDEVAAVEGVPVGTVKSRLSRGRAHLRRVLGEPDEADDLPEASTGTSSRRASSNPGRSRG